MDHLQKSWNDPKDRRVQRSKGSSEILLKIYVLKVLYKLYRLCLHLYKKRITNVSSEEERHMIKIKEGILLREDELSFTFSRSSKPGGQNVNKISSRVTLLFDVANSPSLSAEHKKQIMTRLRTRVNKEGVLRVVAQLHRSQAANREAAIERFVELLQETLKSITPRRKTRISLAAKKRRLSEKKCRSRLKKERTKPTAWDE